MYHYIYMILCKMGHQNVIYSITENKDNAENKINSVIPTAILKSANLGHSPEKFFVNYFSTVKYQKTF